MPSLTTEQARALASKRSNYGKQNARAEARKLQRLVLADALKEDLKPVIRVACVRAWDILEERLRILNNRPLPGFLRPDLPPERRKTKQRPAPMLALPELAPDDSRSSDAQKNPVRESPLLSEGGGGVPG